MVTVVPASALGQPSVTLGADPNNRINTDPVADAGVDQIVSMGDLVTLDGSSSSDPDPGDTITYSWTQIDGPSVDLYGANTAQATFAAPDVPGTIGFELIVSDRASISVSVTSL